MRKSSKTVLVKRAKRREPLGIWTWRCELECGHDVDVMRKSAAPRRVECPICRPKRQYVVHRSEDGCEWGLTLAGSEADRLDEHLMFVGAFEASTWAEAKAVFEELRDAWRDANPDA